MTSLDELSLAFVDVETTGGNAVYDRVIEIAAILVDGNAITRRWSTLLNPQRSIPPMISAITGITTADVRDAPRFEEVADELLELLQGRVFVAHNARFDYGFLKNEFRRLEREWTAKTLCTVRLSRALYPRYKSHSLDQLIERFGFACDNRHRALDDTAVMLDFWFRAQEEKGKDKVEWCVNSLLKRPSLPSNLAAKSIETLPEGNGVYLFYGKSERPLYIGKSVDLHSRVLSHFSGDHRSRKDMELSQKVRRIEFRETVGELGALLLESRLIKQHLPLYNISLRKVSGQCAVRVERDDNGFDVLRFIRGTDVDPVEFDNLYGVFRGETSAREKVSEICEAYQLCSKILRLDSGLSGETCFRYHLKRCKGACAGEEEVADHNLRLRLALSSLKHRAWPFEGAVGIRERHELSRKEEIHVIDQWCLLGTAASDDELADLLSGENGGGAFDFDSYRIIASFLRQIQLKKKRRAAVRVDILQFGERGEKASIRPRRSRTVVGVE